MNIIEKIESEIEWNIQASDQIHKLRLFNNISDQEIKYITEFGHKSSAVRILLPYLGYKRLEKYLSGFLTYLQDINWPAAPGAAKMLRECGEEILPEIQRVFKNENDDIWKYWILSELIEFWSRDLVEKIKTELIYISENEGKDKEGVAIKAILILKKHNLISKEKYLELYSKIEAEYKADNNNWDEELRELRNASW